MFKLAILTPLPPWYPGGIERLVGEVVKRLKNEFDIEIYCTDSESRIQWWEDIRVFTFKVDTLYRFSLPLLNMLTESEYDLIHAHCFSTFMPLAAYLTRKRFAFNPHFHPEAVASVSLKIPRRVYTRVFGYQVYKRAKSIICNSNTEKKLVSKKFKIPSSKIKVIYNGVDIQKIDSAKPYDTNEHIVLSVSQLYEYKNIQKVIQAIKYLPKEYIMCLIGKGPYLSKLKDLTKKLGLNNRVKFFGYLSDEEVYRWLKTCSIFTHLSKSETFGMTCLEALAAGKPVIVNNDRFGLQETADLFEEIHAIDAESTSDRDLAKIILNMTKKRQVNVDLHNFDWDTIAKEFKQVYFNTLQA